MRAWIGSCSADQAWWEQTWFRRLSTAAKAREDHSIEPGRVGALRLLWHSSSGGARVPPMSAAKVAPKDPAACASSTTCWGLEVCQDFPRLVSGWSQTPRVRPLRAQRSDPQRHSPAKAFLAAQAERRAAAERDAAVLEFSFGALEKRAFFQALGGGGRALALGSGGDLITD